MNEKVSPDLVAAPIFTRYVHPNDEGGSEVDTLRGWVVEGYKVRSNWTIEVPVESSRSKALCAKAGALSGCAMPDCANIDDSAESTTLQS